MFFREYCEIFKNTYFEKHLQTAPHWLMDFVQIKLVLGNDVIFCGNDSMIKFNDNVTVTKV